MIREDLSEMPVTPELIDRAAKVLSEIVWARIDAMEAEDKAG